MGYTGFVSMYFTKREQLAAYEGAGLALDYYAGFDATWNEPWKLASSLDTTFKSVEGKP